MKITGPAFIALGSNLGDSAGLIRAAFGKLQLLTDEPLLKSALWRCSPVDCPPGSPSFINAAAGLTPRRGETPETLLAKLQEWERQFGRRPKIIPNEPRPLDLDLIAFGAQTSNTPHLILPHPRAHLRRFVLQPLCEIAPELVLAGQTKTVRELLLSLHSQEIMEKI